MKSFFIEMLEYNHWANGLVITVVIQHLQHASPKCLLLCSHIQNAHSIWNDRIRSVPGSQDRWQLRDAAELQVLNDKHHADSLQLLQQMDLDQDIPYITGSSQRFVHPVRDLLFQIINHSNYHRAQIATECRMAGIEPALTDYIFYKMQASS